jgi:hypothetical protein
MYLDRALKPGVMPSSIVSCIFSAQPFIIQTVYTVDYRYFAIFGITLFPKE